MGLLDYLRNLLGFGGTDDASGSDGGSAGGGNAATGPAGSSGRDPSGMADRTYPEDVERPDHEDEETTLEYPRGTTDEDVPTGERLGTGVADVEPPERFRRKADGLADFWPEHDLDFSPASLERLDQFVGEQWGDERFDDLDAPDVDDDLLDDDGGVRIDDFAYRGLAEQIGSYFGEVLARNYDAEWTETPEHGWVVAVRGSEGELLSNAFGVADDSLRDAPTFADAHDDLVAHAGVDADRLDPDREPSDVGDVALRPTVETPPADADPATFGVQADRLVADHEGYDLDYTTESLSALDRLVDEELTGGDDGELATGDDAIDATAAKRVGGYLGETLVRDLGGEWLHDGGDWTVEVERDGEVVGVAAFEAAAAAFRGEMALADVGRRFSGAGDAARAAGGPATPDDGGDAAAAGQGDPATADDLATGGGDAAASAGRGDPATADDLAAGESDPAAAGGDEESLEEMARVQAEVFAARHPERDLDFSTASLDRLDDLAREHHAELTDLGEPTPELLRAATPYSAYFGEVMRREHGGIWADRDGPAIFLETEDGEGVGVDTLQVAATCLAGNATFAGTCEDLLEERG